MQTIDQLRQQVSDAKAKQQQADCDVQMIKSGRDMLERQLRQAKEDLDRANQYASQLERNPGGSNKQT